jgi:eukaryotic-like serine/threonine-protein kinase
VPDDPDRSSDLGDTDPLADTQTSEDAASVSSAGTSGGKKRVVHAGDVLGRYELIEEIGEGGMATVYRARDRELRREVAIKVLFPHLAKRPEVVHRFHREARAAAGLEHANILRVYDVGGGDTERGDGSSSEVDPPYIVMELIRGHSLLAEIEERGPLLAEVTACIGALLADALAVAHAAGIIHRDVKPANVMVDPGRRSDAGGVPSGARGRLLLADFGVARLETEDSLVTKTGSVLGTPAYMSPEQASGDTATQKSDLYSLGATLYQLATGSLPYSGTPARVIAQIASGQLVPAVRRRPDVGPDLSRVIDRLMATDPKTRPANAADVAAELRAIATAGGFGDPSDELAAYFADADGFVAARQPRVVAAVVAAAERAIADEKLPRAIALADRATALAPNDPAVTTLVTRVTEGSTSSRRRRVLAIAGAGVLVAGGVAFGALQLVGDDASATADAALDLARDAVSTADPVVALPRVPSGEHDAAVAADDRDGAVVPVERDAGVLAVDAAVARVRVDAGVRVVRDAAVQLAAADASVSAAVDAAVVVPAAVDAAIARGFITVANDTWCELSIDGIPRGRIAPRTKRPIEVDAGAHDVACDQPGTGKRWSQRVTVAAGATVGVTGALLGTVAVTLEVDALIDGVPYKRGTVAQLRAGRHDLTIAGAKKTFFDLRAPCVVRATPEPGCY